MQIAVALSEEFLLIGFGVVVVIFHSVFFVLTYWVSAKRYFFYYIGFKLKIITNNRSIVT